VTEQTNSAVNVSETEIEAFKDKVKIIPVRVEKPSSPADVKAHAKLDELAAWTKEHESTPTNLVEAVKEAAAKDGVPVKEVNLFPEPSAVDQRALIKVNPEKDLVVLNLISEIAKLKDYASTITITSKDDVKAATNDLSILANLKKKIEEERQKYVRPINQHLTEINTFFKTGLTEPLAEADKTYRGKVTDFYTEEERKKRETEEIARLERETAERKAALNGEKPPEPTPEVKVYTPPPLTHAEAGTSNLMTVRKYRVIDFTKLPDQYKIENAALLNKVVKAGIPEIPGVEIYTEEVLRVEARR